MDNGTLMWIVAVVIGAAIIYLSYLLVSKHIVQAGTDSLSPVKSILGG